MASFGETKSRSKTRTEDITPSQFTGGFRDFLAGGLTDFIGSGGGPKFRGRKVARILPIETARLADLDRFTESLLTGSAGPFSLIDKTLRGDFLSPDTNPALQDQIDFLQADIARIADERNLEERSLFSRAGQNIQDSSPFSQASARLGEAEIQESSRAATELVAQNFNRERLLQSESINQAIQASLFLFQTQIENLKAQALPRLIKDLGIERSIGLFNARSDRLLAALGIAAGLASATPGARSDAGSSGFNFGILA